MMNQNLLFAEAKSIEQKLRQDYNNSFKPVLGSTELNQKWYNESIADIAEVCRNFELAHEKDSEKNSIYTDDIAYPDNHRHNLFLYKQQVDERELEYQRMKTQKLVTKLRAMGY